MQTGIERLDDLSLESRKQLNEQIARVQKEARKLRTQARRLRRAQHAETRQRKKLLAQIAESSKHWGQGMLQRGSDLASSGISQAGSQLRSGQQKALEYSGGLMQGASQLGSQTRQNLADWGSDTNSRLLQQGRQLGRNAADWGDETAYQLRKQGQQLGWSAADWGDETAYQLRKQGRSLFQRMADWGDEAVYQTRRRGRNLGHNLGERKEDLARQLYLRKRNLGRGFAETRDDTSHQLHVRGRQLGRNISGKRDDTVRQLRKQRDYLSERGGQLLEPVRGSSFWSVLGFVAGLLLAGGVTYWLIKRFLSKGEAQVEESIELELDESFNGVTYRPGGEIRAMSQGGTAVVTRAATSAGPTTRFVGVQSNLRYYPLGLNPDTRDLVYFESEEDARSDGFSPAEE